MIISIFYRLKLVRIIRGQPLNELLKVKGFEYNAGICCKHSFYPTPQIYPGNGKFQGGPISNNLRFLINSTLRKILIYNKKIILQLNGLHPLSCLILMFCCQRLKSLLFESARFLRNDSPELATFWTLFTRVFVQIIEISTKSHEKHLNSSHSFHIPGSS